MFEKACLSYCLWPLLCWSLILSFGVVAKASPQLNVFALGFSNYNVILFVLFLDYVG